MIPRLLQALILASLFVFFSCGPGETSSTGTDSDSDSDSDTDSDNDDDTDSDSDTDTWSELGVCGIEGTAVVLTDSFVGTQDYYLTSDSGMGENICVVRFDVNYVSEGPSPDECPDCYWAYTVELSNPEVVTDVDDVCANSDLGMTADAIAALDGSQVSYGYAPELSGHMEIFYQYNEDKGTWSGMTQSTSWNEESGDLTYKTTSWCGYQ